jgi:hypothetical protein
MYLAITLSNKKAPKHKPDFTGTALRGYVVNIAVLLTFIWSAGTFFKYVFARIIWGYWLATDIGKVRMLQNHESDTTTICFDNSYPYISKGYY